MTIAAYTGLSGHGKSYGVVENVIKLALEQKREVFTNIPMNNKACLERFNMEAIQFSTDDILENADWWTNVFTPGAVIVIDELWRLWPAGLNAKNVRAEDKAFLAEHRHLVGENGQSTEIIFVTQDLSQVANFARSLVETTFRVTKLSKVGMEKRYRVDVYFGPVTGASPPVSKRDREIHGKFKKEVYELYKSHTKSLTGAAGDEGRIDNRYKALGGLSIKFGALVMLVCIVGAYFGIKRMTSYYGSNEDASSAQTLAAPAQVTPTVPEKSDFKFLSKAENIFFTGTVVTTTDGRRNIKYSFEADFHDSIVYLDQVGLAKLKYDVHVINDCVASIQGPDFEGFALCKKAEETRGWIESIVSDPGLSNTL